MKQKTIDDILSQEGYSSGGAFLADSVYCLALAKVEQYRAESEFFEKKHGTELAEFRQFLRSVKGREDFSAEEDLEDWEFAGVALRWWEEKVKELKRA